MAADAKSLATSLRKIIAASLLLSRGFKAAKCKTEAKMATARIKLLRNKRAAQISQMRRDIAKLLESGQEDTARIRVEHVIREQNFMQANEIIELFCELIVTRLPIIAKQRECPADLKEGISSLIFAAPRCSEIPELSRIRDIFEKKYGKDFASAAAELRPNSCVNKQLIEKLSVVKPSGEVKLKAMKAIAKEYQINWDTTETEEELLKPPEPRMEGPCSFVSGSSLPVMTNQSPLYSNNKEEEEVVESSTVQYNDMASAAQAAAEFAAKAAAAAKSAADLSTHQRSPQLASQPPSSGGSNRAEHRESDMETEELDSREGVVLVRRNRKAVQRSSIKFDDSDGLESEDDRWGPPCRPPPPPPLVRDGDFDEGDGSENSGVTMGGNGGCRVHPKLPDYEELTARFEALRSSQGDNSPR